MSDRMSFHQWRKKRDTVKCLIEQIILAQMLFWMEIHPRKLNIFQNLIVHVHMNFCIGNMFTIEGIKKGTKGGIEGFSGPVEEARK